MALSHSAAGDCCAVEAEGCFHIGISKQNKKVQLRFAISKDNRDEALIRSLVDYLKVGLITRSRNTTVFYISSSKDINNIFIPFLLTKWRYSLWKQIVRFY